MGAYVSVCSVNGWVGVCVGEILSGSWSFVSTGNATEVVFDWGNAVGRECNASCQHLIVFEGIKVKSDIADVKKIGRMAVQHMLAWLPHLCMAAVVGSGFEGLGPYGWSECPQRVNVHSG